MGHKEDKHMFAKINNSPLLWVQKKLFSSALDEAWQEGFDKGSSRARDEFTAMLRRELKESSLNDFSNEELKLGYNVAHGIVLDILDGKR
jgi:hypothetical protein